VKKKKSAEANSKVGTAVKRQICEGEKWGKSGEICVNKSVQSEAKFSSWGKRTKKKWEISNNPNIHIRGKSQNGPSGDGGATFLPAALLEAKKDDRTRTVV
jgi:hypothetical protein